MLSSHLGDILIVGDFSLGAGDLSGVTCIILMPGEDEAPLDVERMDFDVDLGFSGTFPEGMEIVFSLAV